MTQPCLKFVFSDTAQYYLSSKLTPVREHASDTAKAQHKVLDWHAQSYMGLPGETTQHNLTQPTHTALGLSHTHITSTPSAI